jgi:hypothetical protein
MTNVLKEFLDDSPASKTALDWFSERNIQLIITVSGNWIEIHAFSKDQEEKGYAFDGDMMKALRATARRWQTKKGIEN